jgi:hypothetical protein
MDPADLEQEIAAALRRLPSPRAPRSLMPRVMEAVRARSEEPWYRGPWFRWPAAGRMAAGGMALLLIAASAWWMPSALAVTARTMVAIGGSIAESITQQVSWQPPENIRRVLELAAALQAVWRTLLAPLVFYASAFAVVMGGVFALCAAVLTRVTLGRAVT